MRRFRALAVIALLVLAGQAATYRVQRGDTLSRIARKHGTSVGALAEANKLPDPDRIIAGQTLVLPAEGSGVPSNKRQPLSSDTVVVGGAGQRRHTVRAGENLARIARRYGTTTAAVAEANNISNPNRIRAGQTLAIPGGGGEPWLCPVNGQVWFSDSWGAPRPGGRRHMGTDLFAFRGTPVVASVSGRLTHASGSIAGNAFYLYGDDGNRYYGAHLDRLEAKPGRIGRGARIGTVGSTGNAEGLTPHLHLEIHLDGKRPVNPLPTAQRWCT